MTDEPPAIRPRTPAEKLQRCAELLLRPKVDNELRAGIAITLQRVADDLDADPGLPMPIRPDGSHAYVSTHCAHGDHTVCRLRCKTCNADCLCDCGHPNPEPS